METKIRRSSFSPGRVLTAAAATICIGIAAPAISEAANTAANATLRNTVTLKYQNASGAAMADKTATVDILVALKAATPTLTLTSAATATTELDVAVDYTYTIATNANGPDTYNLTNTVTDMANVGSTASTVEYWTGTGGTGTKITSVDLGATTAGETKAITAATATTIKVLRDNGGYGSTINNLANGDKVLVGATQCTVSNIVAASGYGTDGTTTLDVTCLANVTINLGDQIREIQTVYLYVKPGSLTSSAAADQTIVVNTSAQDAASVAGAAGPSTTTTTIKIPHLTITKYVRNVTPSTTGNATANATGKITVNTGSGSLDYYKDGASGSGVKGKPGDTLEYVVAVTNDSTGGVAKDVKISDPMTSYTTYVAGSIAIDPGTGTFAGQNDSHNTPDAGEFDSTNKIVYCYLGTGGADSGATFVLSPGGTLAANKTTYCAYKVTIN